MNNKIYALLISYAFVAACTGPRDEPTDSAAQNLTDPLEVEQQAAPSAIQSSGITQIAYFKASNPSFGANFGSGGSAIGDNAVSLSDDGMTLAVGAPFESSSSSGINGDQDDESLFGSGAVYIFANESGSWVRQAYIKASNPGVTDNFGFATSLSADGNTLAVSAHFESSAATGINGDQNDDSIGQSGAAYVFVRNGTTWTQEAYIKASNTGHVATEVPADAPPLATENFGNINAGEYSYENSYGEEFDDGDQFGAALALSDDGNKLIVSATAEDSNATGMNGDQLNNSKRSAGAAYVFEREGETWTQTAYLKPSNPEVDALFGYSLAITGDGRRVAIGGYDEDGSPASTNEYQDGLVRGTGAIYVFDFDGDTWDQIGYLKASNAERGDSLGVAVAISDDGKTVIGTAQDEDGLTTGINNIPGPDYQDDIRPTTGAVYAFVENNDGSWSQQAYIKASNTGSGDVFGSRLAVSGDGNVLVVGAQYEDSSAQGINGLQDNDSAQEAGAVYVFTREGQTWLQEAYVKGSNTEMFDEFGSSVSISKDGSVFVVGAYLEDSNAVGVDGDQDDNSIPDSGAVYMFSR
ncbi:MAG: integrin [Candidatus Rariloculaceae bacterium]